MNFPSLYQAKAVSIKAGAVEAFVPQVFGETTITITDSLGAMPEAPTMGWVFFQAGNPEFPVWSSGLGLGGGGGGGGSGLDTRGFTFIQEATPNAIFEGDTWWQSSTGLSFVWFNDGTSAQWVQFAPGSGGGGGGGPAPSGELSYVHNQGTSAATWMISHGLGFYPNVIVIDSGLSTVEGDVTQIDANTMRIQFSGAFTGTAYLS